MNIERVTCLWALQLCKTSWLYATWWFPACIYVKRSSTKGIFRKSHGWISFQNYHLKPLIPIYQKSIPIVQTVSAIVQTIHNHFEYRLLLFMWRVKRNFTLPRNIHLNTSVIVFLNTCWIRLRKLYMESLLRFHINSFPSRFIYNSYEFSLIYK